MEDKRPLYIAGAVLALLMFANQGKSQPSGRDTPAAPVAVQSGPSAEMQTIVADVLPLHAKNPEAAVKTAALYRAAADVVRRDDKQITTTGQFRAAKIAADQMFALKTPLVGALGSGPLVDAAIAQAIGLEDAPLDAAKRQRLADVLDAIAWAMEGGK